jgi:8-oxo-dGTP pyrophosphatase MutT (NUDIX family)
MPTQPIPPTGELSIELLESALGGDDACLSSAEHAPLDALDWNGSTSRAPTRLSFVQATKAATGLRPALLRLRRRRYSTGVTTGSSREHPLHRPASRLLVLDEHDRLLLFRVEGGNPRPKPLWITPGGGVHDGESHESAARRELWEETGIDAAPGPLVWTRRHLFEFNGVWLDEVERFYVVRVEAPELTRDHFEAHEHAMMPEHRWWPTEEIAASDHWFAPRRLAELLPPILAGCYPVDPVDTGV